MGGRWGKSRLRILMAKEGKGGKANWEMTEVERREGDGEEKGREDDARGSSIVGQR